MYTIVYNVYYTYEHPQFTHIYENDAYTTYSTQTLIVYTDSLY